MCFLFVVSAAAAQEAAETVQTRTVQSVPTSQAVPAVQPVLPPPLIQTRQAVQKPPAVTGYPIQTPPAVVAAQSVPTSQAVETETNGATDTDTLRLNETYRQAIESGLFLPAEPGSLSLPLPSGASYGTENLTPAPLSGATGRSLGAGLLRGVSSELPLAVDFSEYLGADAELADTLRQLTDSATLTPAVFMLMHFKPRLAPAIDKSAYTPTSLPAKVREVQVGKLPIYVSASVSAGNMFLDEVRDGQRRGSLNVTLCIRFSAEELLELAFWKSARNKARNRRRENTWKYYNDYP